MLYCQLVELDMVDWLKQASVRNTRCGSRSGSADTMYRYHNLNES